MKNNRKAITVIAVSLLVLSINSIFIVNETSTFAFGNLIKAIVVCFYYLVSFCFDRWLDPRIVIAALIALVLGVCRKKEGWTSSWSVALGGAIALYISILV